MRRWLVVVTLLLLSEAGAKRATASQICKAILAKEVFKIEGWKAEAKEFICLSFPGDFVDLGLPDAMHLLPRDVKDFTPRLFFRYTEEGSAHSLEFSLAIYNFISEAAAAKYLERLEELPNATTLFKGSAVVSIQLTTNSAEKLKRAEMVKFTEEMFGKAEAMKLLAEWGYDKPILMNEALPSSVIERAKLALGGLH